LVDIFRKADAMFTMAETRSRRPRRRFTGEFKQQAVRLVLDGGQSVTSALGQWVKQARADGSKGRTGLTTAEREELPGCSTPREIHLDLSI
jgi:transposase-like protein